MKTIFYSTFSLKIVFFFVLITSISWSQDAVSTRESKVNRADNCGLETVQAYTQQVLGKNVGFFVRFKNDGDKTIDALEYDVTFKNAFDEIIGTKTFTWQASVIVGPIKPNMIINDGGTNWMDGANKIDVKILRVHFTDGTTCRPDKTKTINF